MIRKVALWALLGLILACLVPSLIVGSERNISILSHQVQQAYADWECPSAGDTLRDGKCWRGSWVDEPLPSGEKCPGNTPWYWASDGLCHDSGRIEE